jgi:hypothetical protein
MSIILVTPEGDSAANRAATWGENSLAKWAFQRLRGARACQADLASMIKGGHAQLICYFGHGLASSWVAFAGTPPTGQRKVVDVSHTACFKKTTVLAIACHSGHTLGPAVIRAGAQAFVGFDNAILWYPNDQRSVLAVAGCIEELSEAVANEALGLGSHGAPVVIDDHLTYWNSLALRGDGGAVVIANLIRGLRRGLVLH